LKSYRAFFSGIYQPESAVLGIVATLSKTYAPPERQGESKTTT
jgi:hypothetical protein